MTWGNQLFLVILIIIMTLLLLGVNIYLLRLYIQRDDKKWSESPFAKVILILGLTLCQAQALLIPLDVANQSTIEDGLNMRLVWIIFYSVLLVFLCVLIPFSALFYETDPDEETLPWRITRSLGYLLLALIVPALLVGLSMIDSL
jgi:flagellar basal body-associated protein FliL